MGPRHGLYLSLLGGSRPVLRSGEMLMDRSRCHLCLPFRPKPAAPFKPSAPLMPPTPFIPPSHGCPFITAARLSWRSCSRRCCSSSSCVGIVKNAQARVIKKISMSPVIVFLSKTAVIMWVDWVQAYRLLFAPSPAFSILRRAYLQWIGATI